MLGVESGEQVTHLKSVILEVDEFGKKVYGYEEYVINGVAIGQGTTSEDNTGVNDKTEDFLTVYFTDGEVFISSTDHLIIRGKKYEAIGDSFIWREPFTGHVFGSSIRVKRLEG